MFTKKVTIIVIVSFTRVLGHFVVLPGCRLILHKSIVQEQRVFVTVAVQPGGAQSGSLVPFNTQSYSQQYPSVVPIRSPPNSQQQSQQPPQSRSDNYSWGPTHPINRLVLKE